MTENDPVILCTRDSHNLNHVFPANPNIFQYQDLSKVIISLSITQEKKKDLMNMAKYLMDPKQCKFYENIPSA